jgi:hypothetical protein
VLFWRFWVESRSRDPQSCLKLLVVISLRVPPIKYLHTALIRPGLSSKSLPIHHSPIGIILQVEVIAAYICRAVAQAVSLWLPTAAARVRVRAACGGLWWTKRQRGRFAPSTSVFLAYHHSTNFSIIIITRGWHNRPTGDRSAEWTHYRVPQMSG